jgi:hypothetical protein
MEYKREMIRWKVQKRFFSKMVDSKMTLGPFFVVVVFAN